MIGRDVLKMMAVGLVWGSTNALMRRGAILWDQAPQTNTPQLKKWLKLFLIWQYILPFLIDLSASATFFAILSETPISVAVPVTKSTTFAATAVCGIILGEKNAARAGSFGYFTYSDWCVYLYYLIVQPCDAVIEIPKCVLKSDFDR